MTLTGLPPVFASGQRLHLSVKDQAKRVLMKALNRGVGFFGVLALLAVVGCSRSADSDSDRGLANNAIAPSDPALGGFTADTASLTAVDKLLAEGGENPRLVDDLIRMTKARSGKVRARAVRALGHVASDRVDVMRQAADLVGDADAEVAAQAAAAIGRIAKRRKGANDTEEYDYVSRELVKACGHGDATVRKAALETLLVLDPDPAVLAPIIADTFRTADPTSLVPFLGTLADMGEATIPLLQKALEDPASAYWAGVIARDMGPAAAAAVPALRAIVGDDNSDPTVRLQAVLAIAAIGAPDGNIAVRELRGCLAAKEASLREAAAFALGNLKATTAKSTLRRVSSDANPAVASMAAWALAKMSPEEPAVVIDAVHKLTERLVEGETATRITVLSALAELGGNLETADKRKLAESVIVFLGDTDSRVRSAAVAVFEPLGIAGVESLADAVQDPASRQSALLAILALREKDASLSKAVVPLLSGSDPDDIIGACLALAATGRPNETAVAELASILGDLSKSIDVRRSATYALGKCGIAAESATNDLIAARKSDDPLLRVLAHWAVANVHPTDIAAVGESVSQLESALAADDESIRTAATLALGDLGATARDALKGLERVADDDPTPEVREAAKNAMAKIRGNGSQ